MATQYFPVSTHWPAGTFPNTELWAVLLAKATEMITQGKMVTSGLHKETPNFKPIPEGYTIDTVMQGETSSTIKPDNYPVMQNYVQVFDHVTKKVSLSLDNTTVIKVLRICKTEADANELINFILGLGASQCIILTNDDLIAEGISLPDDSIIANYFQPV